MSVRCDGAVFFFFQAEDGIRDSSVTGVQTCALPILMTAVFSERSRKTPYMNTSLDLSEKTAVIIGGTSGIGLTLAKGLAQAGANVVPTGRRADLVKSAADAVREAGKRSLAMPTDVNDRTSLQALLDATLAEFGSVHILVNCAGRTKRTPTLQVPENEWNEILETNLNGTLRACQVFGPHMVERKYGRIINIASLTSFVALYDVAAYGASKAAVVSLTRSLATELAQHGLCVNATAPGT